MDPDNVSPFAEEPIVAEAVAVEPQEPRLSIMHLLVWTACVAVYFSFMRTVSESGRAQFFSGPGVFPVLYGLGMGTALAGLVLLVSRRWRGFPLAKYPGEYLLLLSGVHLVFSVVMPVMEVLIIPVVTALWPFTQYVSLAGYLALLLARAPILLLAAIRVKARRWRVFFVIAVIALAMQLFEFAFHLLGSLFGLRGVAYLPRLVGNILRHAPLVATVALMVIVLMDLYERKHYPWQHWLGVGLRFWISAFTLGSLVYYSMLRGSAF